MADLQYVWVAIDEEMNNPMKQGRSWEGNDFSAGQKMYLNCVELESPGAFRSSLPLVLFQGQMSLVHTIPRYFLCSWDRVSLTYSSKTNKIQLYTMVLFCFLPLSWVSSRLTHDSGKKQKNLDKYPMLCIQFWAPDDGRRNHLKHVEHL